MSVHQGRSEVLNHPQNDVIDPHRTWPNRLTSKSSTLSPLAIDFVGLEIAQRRTKDRRTDAAPRGTLNQISNRVFAFGGAPLFHVNQHGRTVG